MNFYLSKKTVLILAGILVVLASFGLGVYFGYESRPEVEKVLAVLGKEPQIGTTGELDFSPFWKSWRVIEEKYVSSDGLDRQSMLWGSIEGLAASLDDPYTVFLPPVENKTFEDEIRGDFEGVGMEISMRKGALTVVAPLNGTPAYRAGIKSGDKIIKIDDTTTAGLSVEKAVKLIRGEKGTTVTLTILRDGEKEPMVIKIVREIITIPTIDTEKRRDGIFVIKLYSFSANSTGLFRNAIKKFYESDGNKLLLDLRGNPGGYLDAAVNIASWFLPSGKPVVIEDSGKEGKQKIFRSRGYNLFNDNLKFVILIDGGSASASEILAGAMQDYKRAKLVGTQSFGKGSVQEVVRMVGGTLLKITVAKWFTPNGVSISDKGLTPDYVVEFTKKDSDAKVDPQMNKAVELLNSGKF